MIINSNLGIIGKHVTLWANQNQTSSFPSQNINISESLAGKNYQLGIINFKVINNDDIRILVPILLSANLRYVASYGGKVNYLRQVTYNTSGNIAFGGAYYYTTYGSTTQAYDDALLIPISVLGIDVSK